MPGGFGPSRQGERALGPVRHRSERKKLSAEQATFSALTGGGSLARGQEQRRSGHVCFKRKRKPQKEVRVFPPADACLGVGPGTIASKPRRVSCVTRHVPAGEPWERLVLHRSERGSHSPPGRGSSGTGNGSVLWGATGCCCRVVREHSSKGWRAPGNRALASGQRHRASKTWSRWASGGARLRGELRLLAEASHGE